MTRTNLTRWVLFVGVTIGLLWTALTPRPSSGAIQTSGGDLYRASSCDLVRERIVDLTIDQLLQPRPYYHHYRRGPWGIQGRDDIPRRSAPAAESRSSAKASGGSAGPASHTSTNVQEQGVDEADLVKTDGKHIYTLHGNELLILKSWPPTQTSILTRLAVGKGNVRPTQLFLRGNRLAVFSAVYGSSPEQTVDAQGARVTTYRSFHGTRISVFDISERSAPRVLRHHEVEGQMLQARMIKGDIYLVTNAPVQIPPSYWQSAATGSQPPYGQDEAVWRRWAQGVAPELRRRMKRALASVPITSLLPRKRQLDASEGLIGWKSQHECRDIYLPRSGGQLGLLSLSHLDLDHPWKLDATAVMAGGLQVYASTDSLFVAITGGQFWWRGLGQSADVNTTQIHKFTLRGEQGRPHYAASGKVPGYLLNQFAMSEHQGHLRVASTDQGWAGGGWGWRGRPMPQQAEGGGNNLSVLRQQGSQLKLVGGIRGLARGERIFAVRMIEDKGYMVTFRQTDPLYTLDLSSPENPKVVGELKINGFSSYIHPLGPRHLLTIGQDADESGRVKGTHLQIFDVSNMKSPHRTHHHLFDSGEGGRSYSTAQSDHHAFTYDPRTRILAIPIQRYDYRNPQDRFDGLVLLRVGKRSGFEELGRVSHAELALQAQRRSCPTCTTWSPPIQRSIVMERFLYTLSSHGLKVTRLPVDVWPFSSGAIRETASVSFLKQS
jgi:uncharacterized secreted protein with C-terminal beta-propeller domain